MAGLQAVQELLQTGNGAEGTLLIPRKIHAALIKAVDKKLIPRSEAAIYIGPEQVPGSSYDFNLETADTLAVREVGEGAEFPLDVVEYTNTNSKPKKYGVAIRITREMMEDSQFPLLQLNVERAGKELAENENSLVVTALDGAANTVAGGAAVSIANITRAIQHLHDADYTPTTLLVGMEVLNDLQNIDTFVEFQKVGNRDMLERGFLGNIYGLNVLPVSTNAGMTATSAYVFDNSQAYAVVEKRRLTVEGFELPTFDMSGAVVSQRLAVTLLRSSAVAKITSS